LEISKQMLSGERMKSVTGRLCLLPPSAIGLLLLAPVVSPAASQSWQATVGSQNIDASKQAMAFLPNEMWISQGDSITWKTDSGESHTVTFLQQTSGGASATGTSRPSNGTSGATGCAAGGQGGTAVTASGANFEGSTCLNSGPLCDANLQQSPEPDKCGGTTYSVTFPTAGNYKLVCLIHRDMTGTVHVLPTSAGLPFSQADYDDQANEQGREILNDTDVVAARVARNSSQSGHPIRVITSGGLVATGGGKSYLAIMRFLPSKITVHVGDTVEWTNFDPAEPHSITFGVEPLVPTAVLGATPDPDGALSGTLPNTVTTSFLRADGGPSCSAAPNCANTFNPGLIGAAAQDETGAPQTSGITRARVTFTQPGTYNYFCIIHDELGMKGEVDVIP
jgi:plastocyanin